MPSSTEITGSGPEEWVWQRYSNAAKNVEGSLCCPVEYPVEYLDVIPIDVLERDYGCGDPSPFVKPGDTVLDLGCGAGKLCFIAAQIVGPTGAVIGVDANSNMLALGRRHSQTVAGRLGYANVQFVCGRIQDLALDLEQQVEDDDGHRFSRGERIAVCDKTFRLLQTGPYDGLFLPVEPRDEIPFSEAAPFDCRRSNRRHPRETKGDDCRLTTGASDRFGASGDCC